MDGTVAVSSSSSSSLSPPSPKAPISETALSIYQRIRLHCRERLIVHPLEWTDRHLELLQCSFERPSRAPTLPYSEKLARRLQGKSGVGYVKRLSENDNGCEFDLIEILAGDKLCFFVIRKSFQSLLLVHTKTICISEGVCFYFNDFPIKLSCNVFFNPLDNANSTHGLVPSAAYIDRQRIDGLCYRKLEYYLGRRRSIPTIAIFKLQLKKITPVKSPPRSISFCPSVGYCIPTTMGARS